MRVSTKGRYALRMMLDLALSNSDEFVKVKDIAKRQEISDKYLEQIITILSRAGFVKGVRGASGGYKLTRAADKYTVGMILRLMEGSLSPVACLDEEAAGCERLAECATYEVWKRLDQAVKDVVDHITLADLVEIQMQKYQNNYVI